MTTIFVTIGFMVLLMLIMAVGVIFSNQPLKGSCGGMSAEDCFCLAEDKPIGSCEIEGGDSSEPAPSAMRAQKTEDGLTLYE